MLLTLLILALLLTIAFFQSLTGLFSAFITFILCLMSAALAFTLYEPLSVKLLNKYIPAYSHAAALFAVFVVSLGLTRYATDTWFRRNMKFPALVDRIGAYFFGLLNSIMIVGMVAISVQMLPFDAELLGFNRFVMMDKDGRQEIELPDANARSGAPPDARFETKSLLPLLPPDKIAVGVVSILSSTSLSGRQDFGAVHPDFLAEVQAMRDTAQKEARRIVPPDTLRVVAVWPLVDAQLQSGNSVERSANDHWLCVRTSISFDQEATDEDGRHRFTLRQVRLVGRQHEDDPPRQFNPIGLATNVMADTPYGNHARLNPVRPISLDAGRQLVDFVFEVPRDFKPWFIEFKHTARAEITAAMIERGGPRPKVVEAIPEPTEAELLEQGEEDVQPGQGVAGSYPQGGRGKLERDLPVALEKAWMTGPQVDVVGSLFRGGHFHAAWPQEEAEPAVAVTTFWVPDGYELYQLSVAREEAQSIFGRALQFARRTLAQYVVRDDRGNVHFRAGEIRIADVDGQRLIELQYWPGCATAADPNDAGGADDIGQQERCIREFTRISDKAMTDTSELIYLFLLPKGATPEEFDIGNRVRKLR